MTINFEPYIRNAAEVYQTGNVEPASRIAPIRPVAANTPAIYGADIDLIEFVDPVIHGEPGWLFDYRI